MKKKYFITCFVLLLPAVAGIFIKGYGGGVLTGIFVALLIGAIFGNRPKTISKIHKYE